MDRAFLRASLLGAAAALLLFVGLLTYGGGALLAEDQLGGFYEAQTRALFDGHLDVDPDAVTFEGFRVGDRTYIYQGPVPALLRMPVMAITDRFDGRLTRISMLAAYLLALGAIIRLGWRVRVLVRGTGPVGRFEATSAGIVTFGAGASTLLFLGARAWVYHEALLWGAALALASFAALVRWLAEPTRGWRGVAWAAGLAGAALLSRPSVGAGPVAALGLVGVRELVRLRNPEARSPQAWARVAGLLLGALLPLAAYAAINQAKFGSPYELPIEKQVLVSFDPARQAALEANDGSLFGLQFAPSVAWQAVRPDGVAARRVFPFVGFPSERPSALGDVVFAERDWSSSVPASEPLLVVLGLIGVVALVVPDRMAPGAAVRVLRLPVVGAAAGGVGILVLGYMANRYLSDLIPLLVLTTTLGAAVVNGWAVGRTRPARIAVLGGLAVLALWGAWVNTSLGHQYQREIAPGAPGDARVSWLEWQAGLGPDPRFTRLAPGDRLPPSDRVGRVVVIGRCDGLYRSAGGAWLPIEGGPETGRFDLDVTASAATEGFVSLVDGAGGERPDSPAAGIDLERTSGDRFVPVAWSRVDGEEEKRVRGVASIALPPGASRRLRAVIDWRIGYVEVVDVDRGDVLLAGALDLPPVDFGVSRSATFDAVLRPASQRACHAIGAG